MRRFPTEPSRRAAAVVLVFALSLSLPSSASAWCPALTDGPPQPADLSACAPRGERFAVFWEQRCTSISLSSVAPSSRLSSDVVRAVLRRSLDRWETADCGSGVTPGMHVEILEELNACGGSSRNPSGPNVHALVFVQDADEWSMRRMYAPNAFAITSVWREPSTGQIRDVDIEINESLGVLMDCPESGCPGCPPEGCTERGGPVDLGNVMTHELGHYFGISHTTIEHRDATMFAHAPFGQITMRDLDPDDVDAICTTYPPDAFDATCDPTPFGGLGLDCKPPSCGCAAPGLGGSPRGGLAALLVAMLVLARRRR